MSHPLRITVRLATPVAVCAAVVLAAAAPARSVPARSAPAHSVTSAPRLSAISPTSGTTGGATTVLITGSGFTTQSSVKFGAVASSSAHALSSTKLQVTAPAHGASLINVRVTTTGGTTTASTASHYTYVSPPAISSVTPMTSVANGGGPVTVQGYHFTGIVRLRFGAVYATGVHVVSNAEVHATVPAHPAADVGVRVYTPYGVSAPQPFSYRAVPGPVTNLSILDAGRTTATLGWSPSPTSGVSHVLVVRSTGSTPPATPSAGTQVASLTPTTTRYLDIGLFATTQYSYSVFAATAAPVYSSAASVTLTTPDDSRPDTPSDVALGSPPQGAASSPCDGTGLVADSFELVFQAHISDPDGDTVRARFRLIDLGHSGAARTTIVDFDDPRWVSAPVVGSGYASVHYGSEGLVDDDPYAHDAEADDGRQRSAPSTACRFRFDATPPDSPTISSTAFPASGQAAHVGDTGTFDVRALDTVLSKGTHVGVQYFLYSFSSSSTLAKYSGLYTYGGGQTSVDIPFTATEWGTNYLYVASVDRAGRESQPAAYSFYVAD